MSPYYPENLPPSILLHFVWILREEIIITSILTDVEKEMATHSSILTWRIPWIQSMGSQELDTTYRLNHHHFTDEETEAWRNSEPARVL